MDEYCYDDNMRESVGLTVTPKRTIDENVSLQFVEQMLYYLQVKGS